MGDIQIDDVSQPSAEMYADAAGNNQSNPRDEEDNMAPGQLSNHQGQHLNRSPSPKSIATVPKDDVKISQMPPKRTKNYMQ